MLNDLRTYTRLSIFFQMVPAGFLLVAPFLALIFDVSPGDALRVLPWLLGLGFLGTVAWAVVTVRWTRRSNAAVLAQAQDGTLELIGGLIRPGAVVPGRVTVVRPCSGRLTGVLGARTPPVPAGQQAVLTVLPPNERPRRLCVLVPGTVPAQVTAKGTVHPVALHPTRPEVGVLVGGPVDQAALAGDPRWLAGDLPTNNSVVGGYWRLVPVGLAGATVGGSLALCIAALLI